MAVSALFVDSRPLDGCQVPRARSILWSSTSISVFNPGATAGLPAALPKRLKLPPVPQAGSAEGPWG